MIVTTNLRGIKILRYESEVQSTIIKISWESQPKHKSFMQQFPSLSDSSTLVCVTHLSILGGLSDLAAAIFLIEFFSRLNS